MDNNKLKGNLQYLNVLLQYAQTSSLQLSLFNAQYLPIMTQLLIQSISQGNSTLQATQNLLFKIMSNVSINPQVLIKQQDVIVKVLLQECIQGILSQTPMETRFLYLNLTTELITALLQEEAIYDYPGFLKQYANEINKTIVNLLLPTIKQLLQD